MSRISIKAALVVLPALVGGIALAAQDRYALQVPGGLAFAEFRGYEDWQAIAVSHNGGALAMILGNPAMIEAFRAGIPGNGSRFRTARKWRRSTGPRGRLRTSPASRSCRARCMTWTSW